MTRQEKEQRNVEIANMLWGRRDLDVSWDPECILPYVDEDGNYKAVGDYKYIYRYMLSFDCDWTWLMYAVAFINKLPRTLDTHAVCTLPISTDILDVFKWISDFAKQYNEENGTNI